MAEYAREKAVAEEPPTPKGSMAMRRTRPAPAGRRPLARRRAPDDGPGEGRGAGMPGGAAEMQAAYGNGALAAAAEAARAEEESGPAPPDVERPLSPTAYQEGVVQADERAEEAERSEEPEYEQSVGFEPRPAPAPAVEENPAGAREGEEGKQKEEAEEKEEEAAAEESAEALAEPDEPAEEEPEDVAAEETEGLEEESKKEEAAVDEEAAAAGEGGEGEATAAGGAQAAVAATAALAGPMGGLAAVASSPVRFAPLPGESSRDPRQAFGAARQRAASEAVAADFVARNAHHAGNLLAQALTAPGRILAAAESAKAGIDAAVAGNLATVTGAIDAAVAASNAQATAAKAQIQVQRGLSLIAITLASVDAKAEVTRLFDQVSGELNTLESTQRTGIEGLYTTWQPLLEAVGTEVGNKAKGIAEGYAGEWLSQRNGESTILDGPIHDNRLEAKADAAREVAKSYAAEFETAAKDQAAQVAAGKPGTLDYVAQAAQQARDGLTQHRDQIVTSLDQSQQRSQEQVNQIADQMLAGIASSLAATLATLEQQLVAETARITGYGESQKTALDEQAGMAVESLAGGAGEAVESFNESLRSFLEGAVAMQAPESADLAPALAEAQAQSDALATTLLAQMEQGILASEEGVVAGGEQAVNALQQLGQSGAEAAGAAAQGYAESVAQMLQEASDGFAKLRDSHEKTAAEVKTSAKEGFEQAATSLRETFSGLTGKAVESLRGSRTELGNGLRESFPKLREDINSQAEEAAKQVQPRWKSVLKWVITVVVIIAVVAITAGAGLGVIGTLALGVALGAAAGAATKIGHNLVDEKEWSDGVVKEMVIGAIGGAFGGIGGALAGKIASTGLKFAVETGVDVVGGVLGDLAVGNPLTLEGILMGAAIGAGVGGGIGIAGALKGKIKFKPKADVNAPVVRPSVDVSAPKVTAAPDVAAGKPAHTDVPAAPPPPKPKAEAPPAPKPKAAAEPVPKPAPKTAEAPPPPPKAAVEPAPTPKAEATPPPKAAAEPAPTTEPPTGKTVDADEPGLVAKRKMSDGHEIKITEGGRIIRCTQCDFDSYKSVLDADPALAKRADSIKKRSMSKDPKVKAKAQEEFDQLSEELERRRKALEGQGPAATATKPAKAVEPPPKGAAEPSPGKKQLSDADIKGMKDEDLKKAIRNNPKGISDEVGDRLRYERYLRRKAAQGKGKAALEFKDWKSVSRGGRKGGPEHQKIQKELAADFDTEVEFGDRFADAANETEIHQIGGRNKRGDPIARERDAIHDILESPEYKGQKIFFHDKKTGTKILVAENDIIVQPEFRKR